MGKKQKEPDLEAELIRDFERWDYLREYGGSDPSYDDATNMNLVRNHIIYHKRMIAEKCGTDYGKYPEIYARDVPPVVEAGYMAMAGEIRDLAVTALDTYLNDANFQYLLLHKELLDKKEAKQTSIYNVLGYVSGLASALKADDLITMRRHAYRPEGYQESFASCAEKVKNILKEKSKEENKEGGQLSLFQFGSNMGQCR